MFKLKQLPEDFIVDEVPDREFTKIDSGLGKYSVFLLKKRNYNTEDAIAAVADKLRIQRRNISYAGVKDRTAVTSQFISVLGGVESFNRSFENKDLSIEYVGTTNEPLSLGNLEGNNFKITIRNLEQDEKINHRANFVNYFDSQRFSKNNADVGRFIIKKAYKDACALLSEEDSRDALLLKEALIKNPNNYLAAIKTIPKKLLLMYVHSFQSLLWNKAVERYLKNNSNVLDSFEIPLVGFATEASPEIEEIISELLKEENLTKRDFILRDFPELSLEGNSRKIFMEIKNLKISDYEDDDLNLGKRKIVVEFFLEKGAYATMAIKQMMD